MKRALLLAGLAILVGVVLGECLTTNISFHRRLGHVVRRGELKALINRHAIYDSDVERAWQAELFAAGTDSGDVEKTTTNIQKHAILERLCAQERLNEAASSQPIDSAAVAREADLLRWQFGDEKSWNAVLRNARASAVVIRREVAANLRGRARIEAGIAGHIAPNDEECRRYFDAHRAEFQEPLRLRASHLFLAAPDGSPAQTIDSKRALINALATRIASGESFPDLVAQFSEDDATKLRGGDLDYFSERRMLPAIFAAAQKLREGETSAPIRSPLGFHLVRLTQTLPPKEMTFEQALPEIVATLENEKRATAVRSLLITVAAK